MTGAGARYGLAGVLAVQDGRDMPGCDHQRLLVRYDLSANHCHRARRNEIVYSRNTDDLTVALV
jgi:hypothetical protein